MNLNKIDWFGWIVTFIMLSVFWPVGVFLLIRQLSKLGGGSRRQSARVKRHPYDLQHEGAQQQGRTADARTAAAAPRTTQAKAGKKKASKKKPDPLRDVPGERSGKTLSIVGASMAGLFAVALLSTLADIISYGWYSYYVSDLFPLSGFFIAGLTCLGMGTRRRRQAKRFRKYLAYIGKNKSVSLTALASAMGAREKTVYEDLQDMLDNGVLPTGYIDLAAGRLVLSDEGISDPVPQPQPQPEPEIKDENAILREIREVNDAIPDQVMSAKIDRIGEITSKILDYQRRHPSKEGQLRSFLNYYLPTTLKVLRAYAQLDAQGVEGENISAAKKRIEEMMDRVVYGFEKQLDRLFQDDALDITSDVEVLENMLRQDGLAGSGMTLGGEPFSGAAQSAQQSYLDLQKVVDELERTPGDQDQGQDGGQGVTLSL